MLYSHANLHPLVVSPMPPKLTSTGVLSSMWGRPEPSFTTLHRQAGQCLASWQLACPLQLSRHAATVDETLLAWSPRLTSMGVLSSMWARPESVSTTPPKYLAAHALPKLAGHQACEGHICEAAADSLALSICKLVRPQSATHCHLELSSAPASLGGPQCVCCAVLQTSALFQTGAAPGVHADIAVLQGDEHVPASVQLGELGALVVEARLHMRLQPCRREQQLPV